MRPGCGRRRQVRILLQPQIVRPNAAGTSDEHRSIMDDNCKPAIEAAARRQPNWR